MALLLIGFAGGFRRSELAAFDLRDLSFSAEGLVLFVGRSKADQERHGAEIGIEAVPGSPLCAVTALRRWLDVRGDAPGSCSAGSTAAATSWPAPTAACCRSTRRPSPGWSSARSAVPASTRRSFSAHSLRAGMMTAADLLGIPLETAMEHGRWKSYASARIYRRHSSLWVGNFTGTIAVRRLNRKNLMPYVNLDGVAPRRFCARSREAPCLTLPRAHRLSCQAPTEWWNHLRNDRGRLAKIEICARFGCRRRGLP